MLLRVAIHCQVGTWTGRIDSHCSGIPYSVLLDPKAKRSFPRVWYWDSRMHRCCAVWVEQGLSLPFALLLEAQSLNHV
jgi:hypothetical protein